MKAVLALIALAAVAGCGGAAESAATPTPTPSRTATPTPATDSASLGQWASVVAGNERKWRETADDLDQDCIDPAGLIRCGLGYLAASMEADVLRLELECARTSGCVDFISEPPAEIAKLVNETETAARDYAKAYRTWSDKPGCTDPLSDCPKESFAMMSAHERVTAQFDSWSPYTH